MATKQERTMGHYRVTLVASPEGYAVSCPALRGCHSQGPTRRAALANIRVAIREWQAAARAEGRTVEVSEAVVRV